MKANAQNISDIAKNIAKIHGVAAVYLFGSHAKGTNRPYSDIDICVITDKNTTRKAKDSILAFSSRQIDTHILSDLPLYVQFRVFQEGKPLCIKSEKSFLDSRLNVIRAYQDFRPRLEKYYRGHLA